MHPCCPLGYILCRLPEVSGVRQPTVELGKFFKHVCDLGERGPHLQTIRPTGREDFCDLLAKTDMVQDLSDALSTAHLPDGGLGWLACDGPVSGLQLVPDGAKSIYISSVGEGKTIFIDPWAHPAYNFWSQVTDPAMRQLQLILAPSFLHHSGHPKQAKICDDYFVCVIENVLGFQIFVHDSFGMKIAHSLYNLLCYLPGLVDVQHSFGISDN